MCVYTFYTYVCRFPVALLQLSPPSSCAVAMGLLRKQRQGVSYSHGSLNDPIVFRRSLFCGPAMDVALNGHIFGYKILADIRAASMFMPALSRFLHPATGL